MPRQIDAGAVATLPKMHLIPPNLGKEPPMPTRYQAHRSTNHQEPYDHDPFHSAVATIWIPASQSLYPVAPEDGQDS